MELFTLNKKNHVVLKNNQAKEKAVHNRSISISINVKAIKQTARISQPFSTVSNLMVRNNNMLVPNTDS
ncbi:MAG: hypothetical protein JXR70_16105 [Spirochaetales bacterium]|nr:hypothetical protein [Spirochaetales bacterium]